jgi:glutamate N-acetyltransferase/amino-acid N-acetyltransferase
VSVTAPQGFVAAGLACGVKDSGDPDLSLVATADGHAVAAAGVFTQNRMTAAPVQVSREHLRRTAGRASAVVLNSGNANAATGAPGLADAQAMCAALGEALATDPHEVLVCSTGLIGIPLPIARIVDAVPALVAGRGASPEHADAAAEAIRTTDTFAKQVVVERPGFTVGGMAKGAAMLAPNMATMLAVLTTDAEVEPDVLLDVLARGVASTFNAMTTDGCTSTNDTVLVLASGGRGPADPEELAEAVRQACESLAMQMVSDAEGATKSVRIDVIGAASDEEARIGARQVADSNLCKCSWFGRDPYWGRVASELGSAGIAFDQERICIAYGGVVVADGGVEIDHDRAAVANHMAGRDLHVVADLAIGTGTGTIYTNDLTHAYVDENMGTS